MYCSLYIPYLSHKDTDGFTPMWEVSENKLMSTGLLRSTGYMKSTDDMFVASDLPKPLFRHPFSGKYDIICLLFDCFFFCASMYEIQSNYLKHELPVASHYYVDGKQFLSSMQFWLEFRNYHILFYELTSSNTIQLPTL